MRHGVPARGLEAHDLVVGDGERRSGRRWRCRLSSNSTISLPSFEMAGERDRLLADAFHQAAVAGDDIGVVIDDAVAEPRVEQPLRQRHADGVGEALAERTGGRLDAGAWPYSGWPAVLEPSWRKLRQLAPSSCRDSRSDAAAHRAASSRGRPTARSGRDRASRGRRRRTSGTRVNSTVATSAMPMGMPGWPDFACLHRVHGQRPMAFAMSLCRMSACATACDGVVFSRASVILRSPFSAVARAGSVSPHV